MLLIHASALSKQSLLPLSLSLSLSHTHTAFLLPTQNKYKHIHQYGTNFVVLTVFETWLLCFFLLGSRLPSQNRKNPPLSPVPI